MELSETDKTVLGVLYGQSADYIAAPHATAFTLEGLEAGDVEQALLRMAGTYVEFVSVTEQVTTVKKRKLRKDEVIVVDVLVHAGWRITDDGRRLVDTSG